MSKWIIFCMFFLFIFACTFNYDDESPDQEEMPNLIMENVEYIRIRSADPVARFVAERAERFEESQRMVLFTFSFEQYGEKGTEVNAIGGAGFATVDIESGDINMSDGVTIEIESEDIIIETSRLEWKDEPRILLSGDEDMVNIFQSDGTVFSGTGFRAEARIRSWEFNTGVSGIFVHEDKEETAAEPVPVPEIEAPKTNEEQSEEQSEEQNTEGVP